MEADEKFLVKVDRGRFLQEWDGQSITVSDTPSFALHLSYEAADMWVQRLRKRRFPESVVCDIYGSVVRYSDVRAHLREVSEAKLPTTLTELDKIPTEEQRKRYNSEPAFHQRFDELCAQPRVAPKGTR